MRPGFSPAGIAAVAWLAGWDAAVDALGDPEKRMSISAPTNPPFGGLTLA